MQVFQQAATQGQYQNLVNNVAKFADGSIQGGFIVYKGVTALVLYDGVEVNVAVISNVNNVSPNDIVDAVKGWLAVQ